MVMVPTGLETNNVCTGSILTNCPIDGQSEAEVSSQQPRTACEQTEDFMCAVVVVIYGVCKSVRLV
jgi:hypothetical protein